jgi:hypothetical protein
MRLFPGVLPPALLIMGLLTLGGLCVILGIVGVATASSQDVDEPGGSTRADKAWLLMSKWGGGGLAPFGIANACAFLAFACCVGLLDVRL